jgi:tryptophan synthase alpha chain
MQANGIDPIFLLAPTSTDERIAMVAQHARGYLYYVSLKGITGAGNLDVDSVAAKLPLIKQHTSVPVGVGFGIKDAATAQAVGRVADAVVVGSRLIQALESVPPDQALKTIADVVGGMRRALDELKLNKEAA